MRQPKLPGKPSEISIKMPFVARQEAAEGKGKGRGEEGGAYVAENCSKKCELGLCFSLCLCHMEDNFLHFLAGTVPFLKRP